MSAEVVNVSIDEDAGSLDEVIGAHATLNGGGTTQIYTVDGTALNDEHFVFTPTSGYNSGGHGHLGIGYPVSIQIVDNGLSKGSENFDLMGLYPNGNTIDYKVTINNNDPAPIPTPAEHKFLNDFKMQVKKDPALFHDHPFQVLGNAIRANAQDFYAAVSDTSQRIGIVNAATLNGTGEITLGAAIAFGAELAVAGGAAPIVGWGLAITGVGVALKGAYDSVDLSHIGQDIRSEFQQNR